MNQESQKVMADQLRRLADAIESAEGPDDCGVSGYLHVNDAGVFRSLARAMTPFEKSADQMSFMVTSEMGGWPWGIRLMIDRGKICRKVKVRKEVEVEEFECDDSILDPLPEVDIEEAVVAAGTVVP